MNKNIIDNTFDEWTKGLASKEALISVFKHIRDIPYAIVPELRDPKRGTSGILELNKGSCQPKHFLLALLFNKLGIEIKYVTYSFKWQDQPIKFPEDIARTMKNLPFVYHLACKANIDNKWILIDATHDLALEKGGFPVNKDWDGVSETKNAVTPVEEIVHHSLEERVSYESDRKSLYTDKEKGQYEEFVEKLNLWLIQLREK